MIYACFWPDKSVTFVSAEDKTEAMEVLDEHGAVELDWVVEYDGPKSLFTAVEADNSYYDLYRIPYLEDVDYWIDRNAKSLVVA